MKNSIKKIKLSNFRNHKRFDLSVDKKIIGIYGENGSGKTNILEAISLLAKGRGLRSAKLSEISHIDSEFQPNPWAINAIIAGEYVNNSIGTALLIDDGETTDKRIITIDGKKVKSQADLDDYISIISLVPADYQIFAMGASSRRSYLDKICSNFYNQYSYVLNSYDSLRYQRKNLLLQNNADLNWLDVLEEQIADKMIAIADFRLQAVNILNQKMDVAESIDFPKAIIKLQGIENDISAYPNIKDYKNYLTQSLEDIREKDKNSGKANFGVNKTDLIAIHSKKQMPAQICSMGEQKALLLSITIARLEAQKFISNNYPILLLDEVATHLDDEKREQFYDYLKEINSQIWLTSTDKRYYDQLDVQQVGLS